MKADGMRPHERETAAEIQRQGAEQVCEKKNEDQGISLANGSTDFRR